MEFAGLGHVAPVTHPEAINAAVARFLARHTRRSPAAPERTRQRPACAEALLPPRLFARMNSAMRATPASIASVDAA